MIILSVLTVSKILIPSTLSQQMTGRVIFFFYVSGTSFIISIRGEGCEKAREERTRSPTFLCRSTMVTSPLYRQRNGTDYCGPLTHWGHKEHGCESRDVSVNGRNQSSTVTLPPPFRSAPLVSRTYPESLGQSLFVYTTLYLVDKRF